MPPFASRPFGSIPFTFAPVALRAALASRGKPCGLSPPRRLGTPVVSRTGSAGSARPAPHRMGSARWVRRGLLRQVVRMRAIRDAGGSLPVCHEGWFTDTRPVLAGGSTPRLQHGRLNGWGAFPPIVGEWPCPCQGACRCSLRAGMPSWPWLLSDWRVVRPKASLCCCESWRGRGCASGFRAATVRRKQFPLRCAHSSRDKFFSPPGSPLRCARKRCSPPVPRRPDHNKDAMGANLVQP